MVRIVVEDAGPEDDRRVKPDVVQNRFGIVYGRYTLLELGGEGRSLLVPLHVEGKEARLGLLLSDASTRELEELCVFVFAHYPVRRISWECSLSPLGHRYIRRNHTANHWKILLSASPDDLWAGMSRKSRYNRRREERNLLERLGVPELTVTEYEGAAAIPPAVVEKFFAFKKELMGREYGLSPTEYLSRYHVTNAYTWTAGERTVAIVLTCEQGDDVFLENLTYDPDLEEFSPGFHLYALVLERLIAKGKSAVFLGGGHQPYKARFNGIEDVCWNVEAFRSPLAAMPYYAAKLAGRIPGAGKAARFVKRGFRFVRVRVKWAAQKLFFSLVPVRNALNTEKRDFSITVSLTSFPPRLATLHLCVKSLMRQTMKPDRIVLYLGADCDGIPLPKSLLALRDKGLTIRYVGGDLRPHKKYIYAMREFPGDFIITTDDDLMFCRDMIASLWKAHLAHPGALVANRVHLMRAAGGRILPYRDWLLETGSVREPTHALLSTNGAGSLFPPGCLPPEALDGDLARELCLNADDIWLKFMLIRGGTKVVWAGKRATMPDEIRIKAARKQALMDGNLTGGGNDGYVSAMESYFRMSLADYC